MKWSEFLTTLSIGGSRHKWGIFDGALGGLGWGFRSIGGAHFPAGYAQEWHTYAAGLTFR